MNMRIYEIEGAKMNGNKSLKKDTTFIKVKLFLDVKLQHDGCGNFFLAFVLLGTANAPLKLFMWELV